MQLEQAGVVETDASDGTRASQEELDRLITYYREHLERSEQLSAQFRVAPRPKASRLPLVGPLIDRLRAMFHELVIYYVDQMFVKQSELNNHMLRMASFVPSLVTGEIDSRLFSMPAPLPESALSTANEIATMEDVKACFRLLLNREIDEESWNYWTHEIGKHHMSRAYVVDRFLNSAEFKEVQLGRTTPVPVQVQHGFKLFVRRNDNYIGAVIERTKQYEPNVAQVILDSLSRGDTFIDVGANVGFFAMLGALRVGPTGKVFAFEPNPQNCELISQSAAANGFENIISLHNVAVDAEKGEILFTKPGINSNGRVVNPVEAADGKVETFRVEAVMLDEVLKDCRRVSVIKMDVEGAEPRVWRGMQAIVQRHRPTIVFEFSPILLNRTSEVDPAAFLKEIQDLYDLFIILPAGNTAARPDSIPAIIKAHEESGFSHIDLVARPREWKNGN